MLILSFLQLEFVHLNTGPVFLELIINLHSARKWHQCKIILRRSRRWNKWFLSPGKSRWEGLNRFPNLWKTGWKCTKKCRSWGKITWKNLSRLSTGKRRKSALRLRLALPASMEKLSIQLISLTALTDRLPYFSKNSESCSEKYIYVLFQPSWIIASSLSLKVWLAGFLH